MKRSAAVLAACAAVLLSVPAQANNDAPSTRTDNSGIPSLHKNCAALNRKYPHGLGRANARDRTSGDPVTNFKRSTKQYKLAMSYNRGLDRDKDGIACEKA